MYINSQMKTINAIWPLTFTGTFSDEDSDRFLVLSFLFILAAGVLWLEVCCPDAGLGCPWEPPLLGGAAGVDGVDALMASEELLRAGMKVRRIEKGLILWTELLSGV